MLKTARPTCCFVTRVTYPPHPSLGGASIGRGLLAPAGRQRAFVEVRSLSFRSPASHRAARRRCRLLKTSETRLFTSNGTFCNAFALPSGNGL